MVSRQEPILTRRALLGACAISAALPGIACAKGVAQPARTLPFMRGMTVSCPRYGQIWGSDEMREAMRRMAKVGIAWTAVHPYAGVRTDGTIKSTPAEKTGYLDGCVKIAAAEKQRLFWKPHLAYWGSFKWRGAITFSTAEAWKRFFTGYKAFIVDHARFAEKHQLPLLSIGIEYQKTLGHESAWRDIIKAVRKVYRGPLTYAANWDEAGRVPFWKELDYIGVQAYFPLSAAANPSTKQLVAAWQGPIDQLKSLSKANQDRPVVFTEIGYPRGLSAAKEPWKPAQDDSKAAIELRSRLFAAAFARLSAEPLIKGAFWWKWIPGSNRWDADFSMKDPESEAALKQHWGPKA